MITHPGIGTYIKGLLDEFIKTNREFILYGSKTELENYRKFEIIEFSHPIYSLSEQFSLPYKNNLDLLHVPHFNIPLNYKRNIVSTIHDLIYLFDNKSPRALIRNVYTNFMIKNCFKKAKKIIAVSENTRDDLKKYYPNENFSKINIIHEASRSIFCKITKSEILLKTKNKYNLPDKFILYVRSIRKHKNLPTLIKAYLKLKNKIKEKLIFVGRVDKKDKQAAYV